jgi:hypothetical protein
LTVIVDGTAVELNTLHGHPPWAAVVNGHEYAVMVWPVLFVAPLTVAVYVVPYARELAGVNVAVLLAESYETAPATAVPPLSFNVNATDDAVTAWLNVAAGFTPTSTPVAPLTGDTDATAGAAGAAAVVNVQEYGAVMVWPVLFVAPLTVAVYV